MHLNRKKITKSKLKISQRTGRKKKIKEAPKIKHVKPVMRANKRRGKISFSVLPLTDIKINDKLRYKPLRSWNNLLKGETVFILGNAPSIAHENLQLLNRYFTIGVNRIFYIYEPTVLV